VPNVEKLAVARG